MGFIIGYLVVIVNPMGRIMVRCKRFRNNLEMLCQPICNRLYMYTHYRAWYHARDITIYTCIYMRIYILGR